MTTITGMTGTAGINNMTGIGSCMAWSHDQLLVNMMTGMTGMILTTGITKMTGILRITNMTCVG